jgi:anaerobic magnesium-protoporphyrin IX monomethyl ester cyclase
MKVLLGSVGDGCRFNIGLLYLVSYARKYGKEQHLFKISSNILEDTQTFNPDIIGLYCATRYAGLIDDLVSKLKVFNPNIKVILGGHHVSALPETILINKQIDYVVVGEGEKAFLDILENKVDSGIVKHESINPLDIIPFPARDLIELNHSDWIYMVTSRGCPYTCIYCSPQKFWGTPRYFSAKYVVEELKSLVNQGFKRVCFGDDLFIGNLKRLTEIVDLFKAEKLEVDLACTVRANLVNQKVCDLLKELNMKRVSFGAESGCEKTLQFLKNGSVSMKDNCNAVEVLKRNKFIVNGSFIVGSPLESFSDAQETLKFISKSSFDGVALYTFTPYPGTASFKEDFINYGWSNFDVYRRSMIFPGKMSDIELKQIYSEFEKIQKRKNIAYLIKRVISDPKRLQYVFSGMLKKQSGKS